MDARRYPTLFSRLAIALTLLAALSTAVVTYFLFINFKTEQRENLRQRLKNIVTLASYQQNGDVFERVTAQDDEFFQQIHAVNLKIKQSDPDLAFVYTMRKSGDVIAFVVDAGAPGEADISAYGDIYLEPSDTLVASFDTMSGAVVEQEIYTDEFGSFLSAYTPIYTSDRRVVGVLGVDISATTIVQNEVIFRNKLIIVNIIAYIAIIFTGFLIANYLAKPIIELKDAANRISKGDFSNKIYNIPHTRELAELATNFNAMTENLNGLITDLERRVAERTEVITRKTDQLRAASYIARQASELQDLPRLLSTFVHLVSDQFGYYHTGVYLVNDSGDEFTLRSASSEGGMRMMKQEHSIRPGMQGAVNHVTQTKKPKIIADVGADATVFNNPDLPLTRSEIAVPLLIRGRLLGVLDIQSDKPSAFTTQDLDVFETLADQLAVAIDNARLLEESQAALTQLEAITTSRTHDAWDQKLKGKPKVVTYTPLGMRAEKPTDRDPGEGVQIPVTLRGQQIGKITLAKKDTAPLNQQDREMIDEVATQAGLAIENIRLLEDATARAKQEQLVGGLAFRFSQALDVDSLLQTATRELGQIPGVEEATIVLTQQPEQDAPQRPTATRHPARRNAS